MTKKYRDYPMCQWPECRLKAVDLVNLGGPYRVCGVHEDLIEVKL